MFTGVIRFNDDLVVEVKIDPEESSLSVYVNGEEVVGGGE